MRQSQLFTKTRKEAPTDEVAKNAKLLTRAGFIHKEMAGVYSYLPLGLRVLNKVEEIIRKEMNIAGGIEMRTAVFQSKEVWEKTNRWDDAVVDNWFKTKLKNGGEMGLSFTNEEAYSNILKQYVSSYKDLPIYPYDFKNIFRNEARSKSGIMRGREFYWKALYSFSLDEAEHAVFYEKMKIAYENIFKAVGIGEMTHVTFASGGTFSKFSHEFQTVTDAGEDSIYLDEDSGIAINKEVYNDEVIAELGLNKEKLVEKRAVEVGNIFSLGTKFSAPFDLKYKDKNGEEKLVIMGSYGIGLGRLIGTVVEVMSDDKGIVWPASIAPFVVHLVEIARPDDTSVRSQAQALYDELNAQGVEVLWDDRDLRAGEKFADADLIGIPYRVVVSAKTISGMLEVTSRATGENQMLKGEELISLCRKNK
jgi:prolyl-tRNA synthetase